MIAVDTNIVVRLLTQDDELQFQKSLQIFKTQDVFSFSLSPFPPKDYLIKKPQRRREHRGKS